MSCSSFLTMATLTPRRYRWEIVYPIGPKRCNSPRTGWRMIRKPYRRRVLVKTSPVQEGAKSPRSVLEIKYKEEPEEDPKEDLKEEDDELKKNKLKEEVESSSNTRPLEYSAFEEEIESDLESTARSGAKPKELEDTYASGV
ncbi:hypothetical protein Tco_0657545 [Tanacetum coccineum]